MPNRLRAQVRELLQEQRIEVVIDQRDVPLGAEESLDLVEPVAFAVVPLLMVDKVLAVVVNDTAKRHLVRLRDLCGNDPAKSAGASQGRRFHE